MGPGGPGVGKYTFFCQMTKKLYLYRDGISRSLTYFQTLYQRRSKDSPFHPGDHHEHHQEG